VFFKINWKRVVVMEKHFCTCSNTGCLNHPFNHTEGCDKCIQKILKAGEVPACVWINASNGVVGTTKWSMENFSKCYMEQKFLELS
jgi:hypothetical protein